MKIDFLAADSNLVNAPDGAVATLRIDGSDEIVGYVVNHTSADGYTVSTFATDVIGFDMPVIVMTNDDPKLKYEILNESVDEFYETRSRGNHYRFYKGICGHHSWFFEVAAALHGAYWLSKKYINRVAESEIVEANSMVKAARELYYSYAKSVQIRHEELA